MNPIGRREFLAAGVTGAAVAGNVEGDAPRPPARQAQIAITLDLEMSRNFPAWEDTHWDYEKGNLNAETKGYTVEACKRVRARGGVLHCFMLGRTLEQENVDWLRDIIKMGHPVGNHTYDHVNVKATRLEDVQFRFRRSPWLVAGRQPRQVIVENIRLTNAALKTRLGINAAGFRTPGGFPNGLADSADAQQALQDLGFTWVSSKYPAHLMSEPGTAPSAKVFDSIVKAQTEAQPFTYPKGLVEVPMSPVSDIGAFRNGRWKLDSFLRAIRLAVEWTIEQRAVFDFLGHPSCLYVVDPKFRTIDLICDLVQKAGKRAALVDLQAIANRVPRKQ